MVLPKCTTHSTERIIEWFEQLSGSFFPHFASYENSWHHSASADVFFATFSFRISSRRNLSEQFISLRIFWRQQKASQCISADCPFLYKSHDHSIFEQSPHKNLKDFSFLERDGMLRKCNAHPYIPRGCRMTPIQSNILSSRHALDHNLSVHRSDLSLTTHTKQILIYFVSWCKSRT